MTTMKVPQGTLKIVFTILAIAFLIYAFKQGKVFLDSLLGTGDSGDETGGGNEAKSDKKATENWDSLVESNFGDNVASDFNGSAIVSKLRRENKEYYFSPPTPRCNAYKDAYHLEDSELLAVKAVYKKTYGVTLYKDIFDTNWECGNTKESSWKQLLLDKLQILSE